MGCGDLNVKTKRMKKIFLSSQLTLSYLWKEYIDNSAHDHSLKAEMERKEIRMNDKKIKFDYTIKGDKPEHGYPLYILLHKGKINDANQNSKEFRKMQSRYSSSVDVGILLTIKGSTELSNMHHVPDCIYAYEKLIKNMISFCQADPNRVYLIGVGFGGDSVYEIATKLSDRFAAVSIISGNSYGINLKNMLNLNMLIQVGQNENSFNRNGDAVKVYTRMHEMYKMYKAEGSCQCFIHFAREKVVDNESDRKPQEVLEDIAALTNKKKIKECFRNTNSISYLKPFVRNPLPQKLYWDLTNTHYLPIKDNTKRKKEKEIWSDSNQGTIVSYPSNIRIGDNFLINHFYWVELGNRSPNQIGTELVIEYVRNANTIRIHSFVKYAMIMLCDDMVDLEREVAFEFNDIRKRLIVLKNSRTEKRTLEERGDLNYIFSAAVEFESDDPSDFKVSQYEEMSTSY